MDRNEPGWSSEASWLDTRIPDPTRWVDTLGPRIAPPVGHSPISPAGPHSVPPAEPRPPAPSVGPLISPPPLPATTPTRTSPGRRTGRSGVVAIAFVLGGVVGAGGFVVGQQTVGSDVEPITEFTAEPTGTVVAPADPGTPSDPSPDSPAAASDGQPPAADASPSLEPAAVVAQVVGPSVVQVETNIGQGSGVVYDDGLVLTNHHVIEGAGQVQIRSADGRVQPVEIVGSDPRNDVAVLRAGGDGDLPVATIGSSDDLQVGQLTVAIGSPFQLQQTVTAGIVSSLNRPVPNAAGSLTAMIQTDAPINPGNSGGALANRDGEVIGINASIRTDGTSNSNVGIGFAIPIDTAVVVADRIVAGLPLEPGVLGVSGAPADGELGVLVSEVTPQSAAANAGLVAGDRIVTIDGAPVSAVEDVVGLIQSNFAGDVVELEILRNDQPLSLQARLN